MTMKNFFYYGFKFVLGLSVCGSSRRKDYPDFNG